MPSIYADSLEASGGELTEMDLSDIQETENWFTISGHYNLVPSIFGLCDMNDVSGWLLYTNGSALPNNLTAGNLSLLDEFVNSSEEDNASNTFTSLSNFTVLGMTFTDIPTAYNLNASAGIYIKEGYFNSDEGDLVFVIQIESSELGYGNDSFAYQSILPLKSRKMAPWSMFNNILVQCTRPVCPESRSGGRRETCLTLPETDDDIILSMEEIYISVKLMEFKQEYIYIANQKTSAETIDVDVYGNNITGMILFNSKTTEIPADSLARIEFMVLGNRPKGIYKDIILIKSGSVEKLIPITVRIYEEGDKNLDVDLVILDDQISSKDDLRYQLTLKKIYGGEDIEDINIKAIIMAVEKGEDTAITGAFIAEQENKTNQSFDYKVLPEEDIEFAESASLLRTVELPESFEVGKYLLQVFVDSGTGDVIPASATFEIKRWNPLEWMLGWPLVFVVLFAAFMVKGYFVFSKYLYAKKRYHFNVKARKLPEKSANALFVGSIAGQNKKAYLNTDNMTTHSLIAGTTGSGKSITAQVIAEEALIKGIPVLVFDPTKQWSGFLRKCEDKRMLSKYSKFGMRRSKAQAFEGNVYSVTNPRELFDIKQFFKKGEINIFCVDRLKDEDIDLFVANTITQFFKTRIEESPTLRLLVIYDEVHRLLPGFAGKSDIGAGFLQLERACREFRKWGIGLILISQLNTDFIGATKANINTQVQMRTTDETDLKMLEKKFSADLIKSIFKADVGNGIITNPSYNEGQPYFITFRPILHNTQSLPDEVLDEYQKYNEILRDLQFKIQKLKENNKEVFDFEIELNLALKQIRKAKFEVARIYLDELKPKVDREFKKLGIKETENLIKEEDIEKEVEKARQERQEYIKRLQSQLDELKKDVLAFRNTLADSKSPEAKQINMDLAKILKNIEMQRSKPVEREVNELKDRLASLKERPVK
jgi:hypothetical protein